MSEQQKREVMQVFASLPEGVRRGFAAGYACCQQMSPQKAEPQAPAQEPTTATHPEA